MLTNTDVVESVTDRDHLRLVRLELDYGDGAGVEVVLLRGRDWLRDEAVLVGGVVRLDMPEMGVEGWANVLDVESCPALDEGPGRLVTGWFRHRGGVLHELRVEGEAEPIRVTTGHPFWSVDRQDWVAVGELQRGGRLLALDGATPIVVALALRDDVEPVYHIEVERDHCYRVGQQGLLVHNASADPNFTRQVTAVLQSKKCCLGGSLQVYLDAYPWKSDENALPQDMGVVYLLRDSRAEKIMKVGKTGSNYNTWKGRWYEYTDAEELCILFPHTLAIDAWAFPWKDGDSANCVFTVETIETLLRGCSVNHERLIASGITCLPGTRGQRVPGEPPKGKTRGSWDGCRWVPGVNPNPPSGYHKKKTKDEVLAALQQTNWNNVQAGMALGVTEGAVRYYRTKLSLAPP